MCYYIGKNESKERLVERGYFPDYIYLSFVSFNCVYAQ